MGNNKIYDLISKMYEDMQEGFKEVNTKIDNITDKLNDLEGTNAANHISINSRLEKVTDDLDFLTHKEFQTEKEIYNIRKRLSKNKRNIK